MLRIICSAQGKFSLEYWRISRKFNAVQGRLDKQKWKVIDEQFLRIICSAQGKFSPEHWRISRKFNAVQDESDKQKLKVIDEQFLMNNIILPHIYL